MSKTWKQEVLYVQRDERGVIVGVSEKQPAGYESDSPYEWVQVEKQPKRSPRSCWPVED